MSRKNADSRIKKYLCTLYSRFPIYIVTSQIHSDPFAQKVTDRKDCHGVMIEVERAVVFLLRVCGG